MPQRVTLSGFSNAGRCANGSVRRQSDGATLLLILAVTCLWNRSSTFARAQGVRLKKRRLEAILGSCVKQRIATARPMPSQPMLSTSLMSICSRVMPCGGLRDWLIAGSVEARAKRLMRAPVALAGRPERFGSSSPAKSRTRSYSSATRFALEVRLAAHDFFGEVIPDVLPDRSRITEGKNVCFDVLL